MNVLFLCLGNICRSPIAAALLRKKFQENNILGEVESAGFETYFINEPADARAIELARKYGVDISDHRARLFRDEDMKKFNLIFVMDHKNMRDVKNFIKDQTHLNKVDYLMNLVEPGKNMNLADPFYHELEKGEEVLLMLDQACDKIVERVKNSEVSNV
ncbi:MAG: low molecular weight phosphotyrosine protein phosphatase [Bacteroidales bacterium]|nr:low molecular weight phosphotyrosine protein phosphatase [Bacteroidales bacterium]